MPIYTVWFAQNVIEEGWVEIEAPNKRAALSIANEIDACNIRDWEFCEKLNNPSVTSIYADDGSSLRLDDDEDAEGATPSPKEAVEE